MCGIVGIVGPEAGSDRLLTSMNAAQRHRGPDDAGEYRDPASGVALAMDRLSILDLAGGHQPMFSPSGRTCIVYNGEIFNAPQLRARLEAEGAAFSTANSDTEVLLELWERKGERMLDDLNGMFAFVLHDRGRQKIFGARDPVGIKPLYYTQAGGSFVFASELKALLRVPGIVRDVDLDSLFHYVSLRFVPGSSSIIKGIKRVPPGHWFSIDLSTSVFRIERYWTLSFEPEEADEDEWVERIRNELRAAVRRWTLSDVPIACSLSGGLDSSAIVGLLADSGASSIRTYSLGFAGAGEEEHNELPLARTVARLWGTDHHEIVLRPEDLLKDLLKMAWYLDEPYGGGLPSWYVFEFMSRDVKVALTGSGSDELFGDYGRFREYELAASGARGPLASMARQFEAVLPRAAAAMTGPYGFSQEYFSRDYVDRYYYCSDREKRDGIFSSAEARPSTAALLGAFATGDTARDSVTSASFSTQLPEEFLLMTDRFSMAHSLEARVPYLDREFVSLMSRIPARIRTRSGDLKYLLKKAVGAFLPAEVLRGRKRGFVIPTSAWLRGALRPLVEVMLRPERLRDQGIFRPDVLERVARPHLEGRVDRGPQVWALLMFQLWHVVYVEQRCIDAPTGSWRDLC